MNTVELLAAQVERYLADRPSSADGSTSRELGFMDSSGLRLLIELYDRSQRESWELKIVRPRNEAAAMVLRATGADIALPFEPNGSPLMSVSSETQPHDEQIGARARTRAEPGGPLAGARSDRGILRES